MDILLNIVAVVMIIFGGCGLVVPRIYDDKTIPEILIFLIMIILGFGYLIIY